MARTILHHQYSLFPIRLFIITVFIFTDNDICQNNGRQTFMRHMMHNVPYYINHWSWRTHINGNPCQNKGKFLTSRFYINATIEVFLLLSANLQIVAFVCLTFFQTWFARLSFSIACKLRNMILNVKLKYSLNTNISYFQMKHPKYKHIWNQEGNFQYVHYLMNYKLFLKIRSSKSSSVTRELKISIGHSVAFKWKWTKKGW